MPAISHVLLNNIFNPSFPTKKWKKLSFFFWKKCKFLRDHFCRGQSSAELMVVSRFFLPQSCQLYFRGNLFFYVSSHCCPMAMWSSSLSVASQFTSLSISHNTSKYAKSKCNKRSIATLFDRKSVTLVTSELLLQLCRAQKMRRCDRMQLRRKRRNSPNV